MERDGVLSLSKQPRALGRSELQAFPVAYGCWRFAGSPLRDARAKIDTAPRSGSNASARASRRSRCG